MTTLDNLKEALIAFRDERNWEQFHSIRNLIVSLNLEAAELLELTQWKSEEALSQFWASREGIKALEEECADVLLYLLLIADAAGIDLINAAHKKMAINAERYPVARCYGKHDKYSALRES